jgi:hypothetical protein
MGITIQNDSIVIKDGSGNTRFSTDRKMPHLLLVSSGTWVIPNVSGTANWTYYSDESYSGHQITSYTASQVDRKTVLANSKILSGAGKSFVAPFITMSGGMFQTSSGQVMSALGSNLPHLFVKDDGNYAGSMIVNTELSSGKIELVARSEVYFSGNTTIQNYGFSHSALPPAGSSGSTTTTLNNTGMTVTYKIYYGRFT